MKPSQNSQKKIGFYSRSNFKASDTWSKQLLMLFSHLFAVNMPSLSLSGTLPRQHPVVSMSGLSLIPQPPQPSYISGSYLGHPTLRRQSSHDMMEQNMPRILGRNATNVQYYYGWQTPPTLTSPITHTQTLPFPVIVSTASGMRALSIAPSASTVATTPLTIVTTTSSESQAISTAATTTSSLTGDGGGVGRTICF